MINFNDNVYEDYGEIARDYNVPYNTLMQRIYRGWTLYQATGLEPRLKKKEKVYLNEIEVNGVKYKSQVAAMKQLNLNRYQLKRLMKQGCSDSLRSTKITVKVYETELSYKSMRQFCFQYNLNYAYFVTHYRKNKDLPQEIVDRFHV